MIVIPPQSHSYTGAPPSWSNFPHTQWQATTQAVEVHGDIDTAEEEEDQPNKSGQPF